jgi:RNA polymerase sigma-70 factor, ECF subfamily
VTLAAPGIARSEAEFDAFFRQHSSRLLGQAYVLAGEAGAAQDLVQETFVRAWERWDEVRGLERPEAWARRVLYNLAVSRWRKDRRLVPLGHHDPSVAGPHPDALVLAAALKTLPHRQAQAIVLHDAAGLTTGEVAIELGVPEGTIRSWLSRGRPLLAALISEKDEFEKGAP